jgi:TPR repeat protein
VAAAAAYCRAAASGHVEATCHLAILFQVGQGVSGGKNTYEADRLYGDAATAGSAHAKCNLAMSSSQSAPQRVELTKQAAEAGHLQAMCNLGNMYQHGDETMPNDAALAFSWWEKAADAGSAIGMYNVGIAFRDGIGVAVDHTMSVTWLTSASDLGYGLAQYNLGVAYTEGKGVASDHAKAAGLYRAAANAGVGLAAFNLACMHMGRHPPVIQDWEAVAKWARHASALLPTHEQARKLQALGEQNAGKPAATVDDAVQQPSAGQELLHSVFHLRLNLNSSS